MRSAFENDPFAMIAQAFANLYPGLQYKAQVGGSAEQNEHGEMEYGSTTFDGDDVYVEVCCDINIVGAVEVFAHELAHVAVGPEAEHGEAWANAFDAIYNEYARIGSEMGFTASVLEEIREGAK